LALPITYFGVEMADIKTIPAGAGSMVYGDPLLMQWIVEYVHGPIPENADIILNPMLFAGWVGIFITALNLIPIGQLDGGHILYTLIGRRAHTVALLLLMGAVSYMVYSKYYAYGLMVLLLMMMGPRHPPTADDTVPLGAGRVALGWLTLCFIFIGFTPTPIVISEPERIDPTPRKVVHHPATDAETRLLPAAQLRNIGLPENRENGDRPVDVGRDTFRKLTPARGAAFTLPNGTS
jgi:hypothetical protein